MLYPAEFYTLIETQVSDGVKAVVPPVIYDDLTTGLTAFHNAASYASQSTIEYHGVVLMNSNGRPERIEIFDRRVPTSEPEEDTSTEE